MCLGEVFARFEGVPGPRSSSPFSVFSESETFFVTVASTRWSESLNGGGSCFGAAGAGLMSNGASSWSITKATSFLAAIFGGAGAFYISE